MKSMPTAMKSLLTAATILLAAAALRADRISDMGMARDWCDGAMLQAIEGIWEFPDDETRVLIRRSAGYDNRYDIIVVETPDTRLTPGDNIGWLKGSALSTKYEMSLYRERKEGAFTSPGHCLAELNTKEDAMVVTGKSAKLSFNLRYLLPSFWKSLRISVKDPLDRLPYGLVRIYPAESRRKIDYL